MKNIFDKYFAIFNQKPLKIISRPQNKIDSVILIATTILAQIKAQFTPFSILNRHISILI